MGIPSYFSYIIKNYSNIIRNLQMLAKSNIQIHHLFMDCNSIVYDTYYEMERNHKGSNGLAGGSIEDAIIAGVLKKIDAHISLVRPTKTLFIAFDGVAPYAKMEQQRKRRYKSGYSVGTNNSASTPLWNTSNITPGTIFMDTLAKRIHAHFVGAEKKYNIDTILISTSNECGEGEHKLFQYIRRNSTTFSNDNAAVYGLDSDLIMLSIFHCAMFQHLYIFREAPEFGQIIRDQKATVPFYFMDIGALKEYILLEMDCKYPNDMRVYDYVFLCFFLGNDFLPHFPALNIRTQGIQVLMDGYRMWIGKYEDRTFISTDGDIQWKWVTLFIEELAKMEHTLILNEYKTREKWNSKKWPESTEKEREDLIQNVPVILRQTEEYICPKEHGWETRYYKKLFNIDHGERMTESIETIAKNYIQGLAWVYRYYTVDCPDWKWKYHYEYPPLLTDLYAELSIMKPAPFFRSLETMTPFSQQVQLAYVLPKWNHHLLLSKNAKALLDTYSHLYPHDYEFEWAFCRYFWEAHPTLPQISIETMNQWNEMFVDKP